MPDNEKVSDDGLKGRLGQCPPAGTFYRHYKCGGVYQVVGGAIHEATQQPLVVYRNQGSGVTFARPLSEWRERVEYEGQVVERFRAVPVTDAIAVAIAADYLRMEPDHA